MADETKPRQPWTPGPWEARESGDGFMVDAATGTVAVVFGGARTANGGITGVTGKEGGANAVLMAAAPAMAEALALFVSVLEAGRNPQVNPLRLALDRDRCEKDARAALDLCGWKRGGR